MSTLYSMHVPAADVATAVATACAGAAAFGAAFFREKASSLCALLACPHMHSPKEAAFIFTLYSVQEDMVGWGGAGGGVRGVVWYMALMCSGGTVTIRASHRDDLIHAPLSAPSPSSSWASGIPRGHAADQHGLHVSSLPFSPAAPSSWSAGKHDIWRDCGKGGEGVWKKIYQKGGKPGLEIRGEGVLMENLRFGGLCLACDAPEAVSEIDQARFLRDVGWER